MSVFVKTEIAIEFIFDVWYSWFGVHLFNMSHKLVRPILV